MITTAKPAPRVLYTLAEDETRIGPDRLDVIVEFDQAGGVSAQDPQLPQGLDEIMEQRLVEEVGGVQTIDYRQPFGALLTQRLQPRARQDA